MLQAIKSFAFGYAKNYDKVSFVNWRSLLNSREMKGECSTAYLTSRSNSTQ